MPFNLDDWCRRWRNNAAVADQITIDAPDDWRILAAAMHRRGQLLTELLAALASTEQLAVDYYCRPDLWACQEAARFAVQLAGAADGVIESKNGQMTTR